jgi:hypothetical protein
MKPLLPSTDLPSITEREFRKQVVQVAGLYRWRVYWTWNSIHSPAGFPDLCLCRPPRPLFLELKSSRGKLTRPQMAWLDALKLVPGIQAAVIRPADWEQLVALFQ